ncbi:MAG: cell division protein SepF [Terrisporobacter sp.]|uniref:cell division protein SepF n=1 Tax=Terrisporobacter sp. TaxID=1965305 RepID=UPI002FCA2464
MSEGIIKRIKDWISVEEGYEEDYEDEIDTIEEEQATVEQVIGNTVTKGSKVVNIHTATQMKVVIVDPKKYDDVTIIADHLKQRRAVIVNLESLEEDPETKKSIYYFMSGAVYILEGSMQKVSKSIFILAPNNVDIDANIKKELESKAFFPWQK